MHRFSLTPFLEKTMKRHLLPLLSVLVTLFAGTVAANSVVWFSVNADAVINDNIGAVISTVANYNVSGAAVNAVRLCAFDSNGLPGGSSEGGSASSGGSGASNGVYLDFYYEGAAGQWMLMSGATGIDLDDSGSLSWQPADLGSISTGATLEMQLGHYSESTGSFQVLAKTTESLEALANAGHISQGGVTPQGQTPWSPTSFTAVPEPTTALLGLLGAGLLLRRRRPARARGRDARAPAR